MGDAEKIWKRRASRLTRRINTGWFFEKAAPLLIGGGFVFALAVVAVRTLWPHWYHPLGFSIGGAAALVVLLLAAFLRARQHFLSQSDGLVTLEDRLALNNLLTAAHQGVAPWPDAGKPGGPPDSASKLGLRWNLLSLLFPALLTGVVVASALLIPVRPLQASSANLPPHEPGAWKQMEEWLSALDDQHLIDEKSLQETREKIDELRQQPQEQWFSHSNMEAADSLRDALARDLQEAGRDLATLQRDLSALENFSGQMSEAGREMLMKEYDEALKNLGLNNMQLNQDLMKQLKNMDLSQLSKEQLSRLSKEQLKQLQDQLQKGTQCLGELEGLPSLGNGETMEEMMRRLGMDRGQGDVQRGPGDAPLFFGEKEKNLKTNQIENVSNPDLERAAPGEVLAIGETKHEDDQKPSVPQAGGAFSAPSRGGDAVWRDSLLPSEKALLKRYFK